MSITHARNPRAADTASTAATPDEAEIKRCLDFADAALGAAGHQVTDPVLRALSRQVAAGTLSSEDAIVRSLAHIDASVDTQ